MGTAPAQISRSVFQYSIDGLLSLLEAEAFLTQEAVASIKIKAPNQRAVLQRERERSSTLWGPTSSRYQVGPGELLASFNIPLADGRTLDEDGIARLVAAQAKVPYRTIDPLELDMAFITGAVSKPYAMKHVILPLEETPKGILVAFENPTDLPLQEHLSGIFRKPVVVCTSSKSAILKSLVEVFGFHKSVASAAAESRGEQQGDFEQLTRLRTAGESEANDQHIVNAVDFLLRYAFEQRASDIHIEPRRGDTQVRLRIDGVLHNVHTVPRRVHPAFVSRIKMLSRLDIAEKRRPQDGRLKTIFEENPVELRISTMPVAFGEKIVIRVQDPTLAELGLDDIGLDPEALGLFRRWIQTPNGIVLITGPTGSGKSTTLYTALRELATQEINVTTIEDPIEMVSDAFNQVAVQRKIDITFASALKTILRQDPDVVMVGEIRDKETVDMSIQAALTGHLVFSTLHTNDSIGAVTRLRDLGAPSYLISNTLRGVMAQRLVRRICESCKQATDVTPDQANAISLMGFDPDEATGFSMGRGCVDCRQTGYRGRLGLFELFDVGDAVRVSISGDENEETIRARATQGGFISLLSAGWSHVCRGNTTLDELVRIVGSTSGTPEST